MPLVAYVATHIPNHKFASHPSHHIASHHMHAHNIRSFCLQRGRVEINLPDEGTRSQRTTGGPRDEGARRTRGGGRGYLHVAGARVTSFRTQRASRGTTALRFLLITRRCSLIVSIYGPSLVIRLTFVFRLALSASPNCPASLSRLLPAEHH